MCSPAVPQGQAESGGTVVIIVPASSPWHDRRAEIIPFQYVSPLPGGKGKGIRPKHRSTKIRGSKALLKLNAIFPL